MAAEHLAEYYPHTDWVIVLPKDHPVHQFVEKGRPADDWEADVQLRKTLAPFLPPKPDKVIGEVQVPHGIATTKCSHCGGTMLWGDEDKMYRCILCGRGPQEAQPS